LERADAIGLNGCSSILQQKHLQLWTSLSMFVVFHVSKCMETTKGEAARLSLSRGPSLGLWLFVCEATDLDLCGGDCCCATTDSSSKPSAQRIVGTEQTARTHTPVSSSSSSPSTCFIIPTNILITYVAVSGKRSKLAATQSKHFTFRLSVVVLPFWLSTFLVTFWTNLVLLLLCS
jgi:hypothetical protein